MPSLKDIRKRISSVRSTQQITKAMKMVAAAKLRRAQEAAEGARPYASKLTELLVNLSSQATEADHPYLAEGSGAPAHVVLCTSDRGLCGGYNTNLIKLCEGFFASEEGADATMTACGRRGSDYFKSRVGDRILEAHVQRAGGLDLELARHVTDAVGDHFTSGRVGSVYLIYSRFNSAISQTPVLEKLLPIERNDEGQQAEDVIDYLYEPSADQLRGTLLPRYAETKVYQAMLEAVASEHGARMAAMDSATRNAAEMIDRLTLEMNRARQAAITTELMEIVSGAEALNAG